MEIMTLGDLAARGRSRRFVLSSRPRGRFVEIFPYGDASVLRVANLASAAYQIRLTHPRGADSILIGVSAIPGMKMIQDFRGVSVLIGVPRSSLEIFLADDGDEVLVAFDRGALRPAGVIGFLWDGGSGADSRPPESNSTSTKSRLSGIQHLRRLNLG